MHRRSGDESRALSLDPSYTRASTPFSAVNYDTSASLSAVGPSHLLEDLFIAEHQGGTK